MWDEANGITDHDMFVAVHGGYGYISFQDSTIGKCYSVGASESPGVEYDDDEFPPGSGITTDQLTDAITEFLETRAIPTCITWR